MLEVDTGVDPSVRFEGFLGFGGGVRIDFSTGLVGMVGLVTVDSWCCLIEDVPEVILVLVSAVTVTKLDGNIPLI